MTETVEERVGIDVDPLPEVPTRWGLSSPEISGPTWGARAIYQLATRPVTVRVKRKGRMVTVSDYKTTAEIDVPWDRCQWDLAGDEKQAKRIAAWINKSGLEKLRRECLKRCITPECDETVRIDHKVGKVTYHVIASPKASYGYLYLAVWATVA